MRSLPFLKREICIGRWSNHISYCVTFCGLNLDVAINTDINIGTNLGINTVTKTNINTGSNITNRVKVEFY